MPLDPTDIETARRVLEAIAEDRGELAALSEPERIALLKAAGEVARPSKAARKQLAKEHRRQRWQERRAQDAAKLDTTGIRRAREQAVYVTPAASELGHTPLHTLDRADEQDAARRPNAATADELYARPAATASQGDNSADDQLNEPRNCYVCKEPFSRLHFFYDQMCEECGDFNHAKRSDTADLAGRVALLTGGRVKIGYQAGILLLRAGARLIVTTRFPRDAAERYQSEPDYADWSDRLQIYGLDLRHTPSVEAFASRLCETLPSLDFIVHNACQTVRRPPGFYGHLLELERAPLASLPTEQARLLFAHEALQKELRSGDLVREDFDVPRALKAAGLADAPGLSQLNLVPGDENAGQTLFPTGKLDQDLQQVDLRETNSWRLRLADVPTVELLEVLLCNAAAPFVLNARLKKLMLPGSDKHIVNVSAIEGQFYRGLKTDKHPHTNMAKAALNMMTRTSAADYARDGIHMNAVDTGWVSDEDPAAIQVRKREDGFHPPLDIVDGAARIVAPIFDGINTGKHVWGRFLKDYRPAPW